MSTCENKIIKSNLDAKAAYWLDKFKILQPHVEVQGVWSPGDHMYYMVCPNVDQNTQTVNGENLLKWTDDSLRELGFHFQIAKTPPASGRRIRERTKQEVIVSQGVYRNINFLLSDLYVELPDSFPEFFFKDVPFKCIIVERELTDGEFAQLSSIFSRFGYPWDIEVSVNPVDVHRLKKEIEEREKKQQELEKQLDPAKIAQLKILTHDLNPLTVSRLREGSKLSLGLRTALRRDEKFWVEHRETVMGSSATLSKIELSPNVFASVGLVDLSTNVPIKINNYYSIFNHLVVILPQAQQLDQKLNSLGVSYNEMKQLVDEKRMTIVLPSDIRKYDLRLLDLLSEGNSDSLVLPRQLTSILADDAKKNFPILFPPLEVEQMRAILSALLIAANDIKDEKLSAILKNLVGQLGAMWISGPEDFPYNGTNAISFSGLGKMLGALWGINDGVQMYNINKTLLSVQVASALGCIQVPDQNNEKLIEIGSTIYSGVKQNTFPEMQSKLEAMVNNLFVISPLIPVTDFVKSFDSADVNKLRRYIQEIGSGTATIEEASTIAKNYNNEAKKFESRRELQENVDLMGFLLSLNSSGYVPPIVWIDKSIRWLFRKDSSGICTGILDSLDAIGKTKEPRAVVIARMKRKLNQHV